MNVVILLPGPSLAALDCAPTCDLSIGVKRVCTVYGCRWCVILDSPDLKRYGDQLIGRPRLLTRAAYRPKYTVLPGIDFETVADCCPLKCEFTSVAALMLAGFLGASRVDAYGADFGQGETMAEWDGFTSPEANYTAARWERETKQWNDVSEWLAERGVEVRRVMLAEPAGNWRG